MLLKCYSDTEGQK